jgi:hypothetical protein
MWYVMLGVMSLCYDMYTTGYDGIKSLQDPPSGSLCPFTYLSALCCDNNRDNLPNNDIKPVPDAKQVMTNINRFQEQV